MNKPIFEYIFKDIVIDFYSVSQAISETTLSISEMSHSISEMFHSISELSLSIMILINKKTKIQTKI
jgi:hypothetical protein